MDFFSSVKKPAKPIAASSDDDSGGSSGEGKTFFYNLAFNPDEIDDILRHCMSLSKGAATLELAVELSWHRCSGKADEIVMKTIQKMLRAFLDGEVKPPYDLRQRYMELLGGNKDTTPAAVITPTL